MKFDTFIEKLYEAGWDSPSDARYTGARKLWEEIFPKDVLIEQLEETIDQLDSLRLEIGDMAHDASTGPAVQDTYWDIRRKAYML